MYQTLISAGNILFSIISLLILVNIIFSWIKPNRSNPIVSFVYMITEPMLEPLKKIAAVGPMDFSPFLAILILDFLIQPLYQYLVGLLFR